MGLDTVRHRVVVAGAGFGGLTAVQELRGAHVDICLIDQRNHHLFQSLLYQVATASLAPSEIAWPIRAIVRGRPEVRTIMAMVIGVDPAGREVHRQSGEPVSQGAGILLVLAGIVLVLLSR